MYCHLQAELGVTQAPASDAAERSKKSRDLYLPSATASWRMNMLTSGNLPDASFRQIRSVPGPSSLCTYISVDMHGLL